MNKKIARNLFCSILSQAVTICLGLVVPRLILIGYGSETNGLLTSVTQMLVYLQLFEAGVHLVAVQSLYKPVSIDDKESINHILAAVHVSYKKTGIYYLGVLIAFALGYPYLIAESTLSYCTIFCVVLFSGLGNVILFFFQGKYKILLQAEGKNYIITNLQTIITVLNQAARIVCISLGCNIAVVVLVSFAISMIQAVYICMLIRKKYSWVDLKSTPNFDAISQRNFALVHQLAGMVFQNTDVLIITAFCGLKVVSVYSIYKLVTSHLSALLNSLYNSISFVLGQFFNTDKIRFIKTIDVVDVYFSGACFSVYTVAAVLFIPFINLYTRDVMDINYSDTKLALLFIVVELLTFSRMPMLNTINYAGHFKDTLPQTLIETGINLIVSLVGVEFFGIYGVLLGTIAALIYRNIDVFLYANHKILNRSACKTTCIYCLDAFVFVIILHIVKHMPININTYVDFIKNGLVFAPTILLIYLSVLSFFFRDERKGIIQVLDIMKGKKFS